MMGPKAQKSIIEKETNMKKKHITSRIPVNSLERLIETDPTASVTKLIIRAINSYTQLDIETSARNIFFHLERLGVQLTEQKIKTRSRNIETLISIHGEKTMIEAINKLFIDHTADFHRKSSAIFNIKTATGIIKNMQKKSTQQAQICPAWEDLQACERTLLFEKGLTKQKYNKLSPAEKLEKLSKYTRYTQVNTPDA